MEYEIVMGLEVHVELATSTKLFCSCSAHFGALPNQNTCPACIGMPGSPPALNKKALELGIRAAILTDSKIANTMYFDKKNYFYPDLPTGYQITQLFAPICTDGYVDIKTDNKDKRITLKQIHMEEDAGKLIHDNLMGASLIDYNRASVPLIEIVSNPDFSTADEVCAYLDTLRTLLSFSDVSDCKMQEGSMRCDVNISVRPIGQTTYGTRTEIKNMNSITAIAAAIAYESQRHIDILEGVIKDELVQETRRWDETKLVTLSMRAKENLADYRYFPNPEILPINLEEDFINKIKDTMPESSKAKYQRLTTTLNLSEYDTNILISSKRLVDIFDQVLSHYNKPKEVANWIIVELLAIGKTTNKGADDIDINIQKFAKLIELVDTKIINRTVAKDILGLILSDNIDPLEYIEKNNLKMVSDTSAIETIVDEVLANNPKAIEDYKNGHEKSFGFLVGQTMKKLGGKAAPQVINELLKTKLQ